MSYDRPKEMNIYISYLNNLKWDIPNVLVQYIYIIYNHDLPIRLVCGVKQKKSQKIIKARVLKSPYSNTL